MVALVLLWPGDFGILMKNRSTAVVTPKGRLMKKPLINQLMFRCNQSNNG